MRIILVVIIMLITNLGFSQDYSNNINLGILIVPSSMSNLEYYQLGYEHNVSDRFSIGPSIGLTQAENKFFDVGYNNSIISFGAKWRLFGNRNVFVDPYLHGAYVYQHIFSFSTNRFFRGGGILGGLNAGYQFKQFGIGAKWQTHLALGKYSYIESDEPDTFSYLWTFFDYGLFLSYKF